ncbi:DMT family transporter [Roseateles asaccharophilus]|uniref:Drug/metabolite transporter (DMT)-like permease n=1 Tax=Roseateles asaccharophilus TaxID=582607 RepID=A0ABU2ADK3_9BURK|nr:DMT family transporter [Roseateles asaccharophilus]MDR7334083.1 drug/metabolite transporter (DMT)-like permease [Roseateles asaccharophilus]
MASFSTSLPARSFRPGPLDRLATVLAGFSLPLLFIVLWSSGYVAGKLALPHTGPLTLLTLRFGLAAVVLLAVAVVTKAPWPKARDWGHLAVVALLMQVLHFSAIYFALRHGLSAGVAGLLIGLMPLATALGAHLWLAEKLNARQAVGLVGGLAGVALVVGGKPLAGAGLSYALAALGLLGLVAGTLYQKRFCAHMDLRTGSGVQMAVSALTVAAVAGPTEGFAIAWQWELVGAWLWLGLVNSIGAFSLMFVMIRRGQAGDVARLFFLVPGMSALMGFVLLGERLEPLALAGFVISAVAVCAAAAGPARR